MDVVASKAPIGLRDDDEIAVCLAETASDRGAIALLRLKDLARGRRRDLLAGSPRGVVVDHENFIHDTRGLDLLDRSADRISLVVGGQNHRDAFSVPHGQAHPATTYIWAASGRIGEFK